MTIMMPMLSVYLFTQKSADTAASTMCRRESALVALRDELLRLGDLRVSPSPQGADVQVEILNLLGVEEGPLARAAERAQRMPERRRILIVRVSRDAEHLEFVCSDGAGDASAERQAARRIHASVDETFGAREFDPLLTSPC
jgi:hypothetical protein